MDSKIYNGRNRTFFYWSYEAVRNWDGPRGFVSTVPTPEMYDGDFHKWVNQNGAIIPIYDPTSQTVGANNVITRPPFPGNVIPKSLFDPTVGRALAAFRDGSTPLPNTGAPPGTFGYAVNNYIRSDGGEVRPNTKISVKGDHSFSPNSRISGYWGYNRSSQKPGPNGAIGLPGDFVKYNDAAFNSDVFRGSWDYAIRPTVFNHFYGGGNNWKEDHNRPQSTANSGIHWKDKVCIGNVPNCDDNLLSVTATAAGGPGQQWERKPDQDVRRRCYGYPRKAHAQIRRTVSQYFLQRLRPPVHHGLHRLQREPHRRPAAQRRHRHELHHRRRQSDRVHAAGLRQQPPNRYATLHRTAVALVLRVRPE